MYWYCLYLNMDKELLKKAVTFVWCDQSQNMNWDLHHSVLLSSCVPWFCLLWPLSSAGMNQMGQISACWLCCVLTVVTAFSGYLLLHFVWLDLALWYHDQAPYLTSVGKVRVSYTGLWCRQPPPSNGPIRNLCDISAWNSVSGTAWKVLWKSAE